MKKIYTMICITGSFLGVALVATLMSVDKKSIYAQSGMKHLALEVDAAAQINTNQRLMQSVEAAKIKRYIGVNKKLIRNYQCELCELRKLGLPDKCPAVECTRECMNQAQMAVAKFEQQLVEKQQ